MDQIVDSAGDHRDLRYHVFQLRSRSFEEAGSERGLNVRLGKEITSLCDPKIISKLKSEMKSLSEKSELAF